MRKTILACCLALALLAGPLTAWAHDYWLMPQSFSPPPASLVETAFACGHKYFSGEGTPDISKFRFFVVTPQGRQAPLAPWRVEAMQTWLLAPVLGPGTYQVAAASTLPEYWTKTPEGMKPGSKAEVPEGLETGKYVKTIKTFLTVGQASRFAPRIFGDLVEIVPLSNPASLQAGQKFKVQVFFKGRPSKGAPVTAVPEGYQPKQHGDAPVQAKTDEQGQAELTLDKPGRWLVYATLEFKTPGSPEADYENHRPYLMFEIK